MDKVRYPSRGIEYADSEERRIKNFAIAMAGKNKTTDIPDYKMKQRILYIEETSPERLWQIAELLVNEGRFSDAYDYIEQMEDEEKLRWFLAEAMKRGDFFNFDRVARKLGIEIPAKEWEELGDTAARLGYIKYAVESYRRAGNRAKSGKIIAENPDFFGPILEMERIGAPGLSEEEEEEGEDDEDEDEDEDMDLPPTLKAIEEGTLIEEAPKTPAKDPQQAARDAAAKARKKKWKKKK